MEMYGKTLAEIIGFTSQKATEILKGQGYTVGFMGISRAALKELEGKS